MCCCLFLTPVASVTGVWRTDAQRQIFPANRPLPRLNRSPCRHCPGRGGVQHDCRRSRERRRVPFGDQRADTINKYGSRTAAVRLDAAAANTDETCAVCPRCPRGCLFRAMTAFFQDNLGVKGDAFSETSRAFNPFDWRFIVRFMSAKLNHFATDWFFN